VSVAVISRSHNQRADAIDRYRARLAPRPFVVIIVALTLIIVAGIIWPQMLVLASHRLAIVDARRDRVPKRPRRRTKAARPDKP